MNNLKEWKVTFDSYPLETLYVRSNSYTRMRYEVWQYMLRKGMKSKINIEEVI